MPEIPDFELIRLIGHGSFGDVWIARNVSGALRAVKVVWRNRFADAEPYEREFRGLQRFAKISLESARQLALLHVGINAQEGFFYSVMELADDAETGRQIQPERYAPLTLRELRRRQGRLAVADVVRIGVDLAGALVELHQHGLIHRDVKLSNVILVGGVPKLADIGLVAQDGAQTIQIGTDGYIPPEGPGSIRADIYATGKVLYELSTGFDRNDYPSLPPDISQWEDRERFFDLNAVIERACKEKPEERYRSAGDLRGDLNLMQAGESVIRLRTAEKRGRVAQRAAAALVGVLMVVGFLYWRNEMTTRAQRDRLGDSFRQQAIKLANDGDTLGSLPLLLQAAKLHRNGSENWKDDMNQIFISLKQSPNLAILHQYTSGVQSIDFAPDNSRMAVATEDGLLSFWDMETLKLVEQFSPLDLSGTNAVRQSIMSVQFSKDGKKIVVSGTKGTVLIWNVEDRRKTGMVIEHPKQVRSATFSPDGSRIATACDDNVIRVWNISKEPRLLYAFDDIKSLAHNVAFSPDGRKLGVAVQGRSAAIISFEQEKPVIKSIRHERWVYTVDFSPDSQVMATACGDQEVRLWNTETGDLIRVLPHEAMVTSALFSKDGEELVTSARDGVLHVWNIRRLLGNQLLLPHPENAQWACLSPDGRWVAGGGARKGVLRVWDRKKMAAFSEMSNWVPMYGMHTWTASSANGSALPVPPVGSGNNRPQLLPVEQILGYATDTETGAYVICSKHTNGIEVIARTPAGTSGRVVLTGPFLTVLDASLSRGLIMYLESDTEIALVDVISGQTRFRDSRKNSRYIEGHFDPSGRWGTINSKAECQLLDLEKGGEPKIVTERRPVDPYFHTTSAFSPDGRILCVGGCSIDDVSCVGLVYRMTSTGPVLDPSVRIVHKDGVRAFSFSADSLTLVSVGEDREAIAWDTKTWRQKVSPMRHIGEVWNAQVSPDGRRLITCCESKPGHTDSLCLWDLQSGNPICSRISAGKAVSGVGYIERLKSWSWAGVGRSLDGLRRGEIFHSEISNEDASALIEKATSQMGYVADDFGILSPIEFSEEKALHLRYPYPVPVRAATPVR